MTLGTTLKRAAEYLGQRGVETPRLDAELLLGKALGLSRVQLYTRFDQPLTPPELAAARELVRRRGRREPVAYVLGEWGFRRLTLAVDSRALIPRPETEVLVERCLVHLRELARPRVLEVGVGSGAIALALVDEHAGARVTAIDNSPEALALARENRAATGLEDRVELLEQDFAHGLPGSDWDLLVSNPPYVRPDELGSLEVEIRDWEPRGALVGEGIHEGIAAAATAVLRAGGWLVLEVGDGQAARVAASLRGLDYEDVTIARDLADRERVVEGRRR